MKPMRDLQKRNIVRTVFFLATLLLSLAAVASARDDRGCSAASVVGQWGYTITGTLILSTGPVPFAVVGKLTADAEGNISAMQTAVVGGKVSEETLKGTGTVNSDCTGTETVSVYDQSKNLVRTATLAVVWDDNAREGRAIFTSLVLVLPDGTSVSVPAVITSNAKKMFSGKERDER
jgi:hypothetical protein